MNDKGLTLVEALLSLFILSIATILFSTFYYTIHGLMIVDREAQQMGALAKGKMEELKSNRIYMDHIEYLIPDSPDETITFKEEGYQVEVSITPLEPMEKISYVNVKVIRENTNTTYNLIRYINFSKDQNPNIYEEFIVDFSGLSN